MDLFEDPLHNAKREKNRQQEISRRTRSHARTLLARIFLAESGVLLVRGEPDPDRLREFLTQTDSPKPPGQASPAELGFHNSEIIPLNRGGLASRARSVQLWRTWIEKRMAGHNTPVILRKLKQEWQTLQSLGDRVAALHGLVGQPSAAPSPFWLEPDVQRPLLDLLKRRLAGLHAPPQLTDLARFICWTAGLPQAERFIEAARQGLPTTAQHQELQCIERFRQALNELLKHQHLLHDEIQSQYQTQQGEIYRQFHDDGRYEQLRQAWEKIPTPIRSERDLYLDGNDLNFQELARKAEGLVAQVTKTCKHQMPDAEFVQALKAAERYHVIITAANRQLKQLDEEKERQLQATIMPLREMAREMGLFDRLRERFEALPDWAKGPGCIHLPARDRDIRPEEIAKQVETAIKRLPQGPSQACLGWLILFCLTDNSRVPIPLDAFEKRVEQFGYELRELWLNRFKPGYETVIENLNEIPWRSGLEEARQFLATGGSVDDFNWLRNEEIWTTSDTRHGASAAPFRAVIQWLRTHGGEFQENEIEEFWEAIASESGCLLMESLARFLAWTPKPSRQQVGELMSLVHTLSHPLLTKPLIDRLRAWANPPARSRLPTGCPQNLPAEITLEARRLAFYQRMAGQAARIPGSIRDILESRSRQITELEHLKKISPQATPSQKLRLENLSRRVNESHEFDGRTKERMLRQIHEVTVLTALSAAKEICRTEISRCWTTLVGFEPGFQDLQWQEHWSLLGWMQKLDSDSLAFVNSILKAHQQHGPAYRQALPQNKTWLEEAGRSIQLEAWLKPPSVRIEIAGKKVMIGAAGHPLDIFLMGSRFNTCVNLHDGFNKNTVMTNAADANKAVIYAWQADGTPLARMLVGIRSDWNLVCYQLYASDHHEVLNRAFAQYCGVWAAKTGLGLANYGSPPVLSGGFWYDDGSREWAEESIAAYREIKPDADFVFINCEASQLEQLHQVLELIRQNRPDAVVGLGMVGQLRPEQAAFWVIRAGLDYSDRSHFPFDWIQVIRELGYHLSAAGMAHRLPVPRHLHISAERHLEYWSDVAWSILALVPLERISIEKTAEFLMQLPANPEQVIFSSCFATCRISPAFGTLPFRRLVQLLRRYAGFYSEHNCSCDATAWKTWAQALRLSWLRRPDPGAFADAFEDPSEIISHVMQLFCRICPDRRFSGAIRRQLRSNTEAAWLSTLQELRALIASTTEEKNDEPAEQSLYQIAFDRELDFQQRLEAMIALIGTTARPDAAVGTLLCTEWTCDERARLPLEMRRQMAEEMLRQVLFEEWKTWPLVYWLAAMPQPDQRELLLKTSVRWVSILNLWGEQYDTLCTNVVTQALEHDDERIRDAAEMIFRMYLNLKPDSASGLLKAAEGWIWPETYQKLSMALKKS